MRSLLSIEGRCPKGGEGLIMLFKNVTPGIPVYLFDRNNILLSVGKVVSVAPSHLDSKVAKMVVDITVSVDGKQSTFTVEDSLTVAYFGNSCITLDHDSILREIESTKATSEQIIAETDKHKDIISKCSQLLLDNNPILKEKKATEERFSSLENKMEKMMEMMSKFMN